MELFPIKVSVFQPLTISLKSPILGIRLGSEYASGTVNLFEAKNLRRSGTCSKNVELSSTFTTLKKSKKIHHVF